MKLDAEPLRRSEARKLKARSRARDGIRSRRKSTSRPASFFSANRLADLARNIVMKYQRVPMPPANLEETVARYNSFVESGVDADFDKPAPWHRIEKPPFYAAWATPASIAAASRPAASASTGSPAPLARATSPVALPPLRGSPAPRLCR